MNLINKKRKDEVKVLKEMSFYGVVFMLVWNISPFLVKFLWQSLFLYHYFYMKNLLKVSIITFGFYIYLDKNNVLTPEVAFVSLALFNNLR